ncbi:hypothetical protein BIT28_26725 [Photobacterium proteolyticum]|uniref:Uncharacterized protein n=1 Tax=Photobacterium proteolyticum TaxID=1903952 RepID=A0A1Q9H1S5_9GAMM|nr:hypothetical protein BIT28_26725 [Photobacterium proteolyticum]
MASRQLKLLAVAFLVTDCNFVVFYNKAIKLTRTHGGFGMESGALGRFNVAQLIASVRHIMA